MKTNNDQRIEKLQRRVSIYISIASFIVLVVFMSVDIFTDNEVSQTIYIMLSSILGGGLGITTLQQYTDTSMRFRESAVRKKEKFVEEYERSVKNKSDLIDKIDKVVEQRLKSQENKNE